MVKTMEDVSRVKDQRSRRIDDFLISQEAQRERAARVIPSTPAILRGHLCLMRTTGKWSSAQARSGATNTHNWPHEYTTRKMLGQNSTPLLVALPSMQSMQLRAGLAGIAIPGTLTRKRHPMEWIGSPMNRYPIASCE
jgi:hypothetical protein